MFRIRGHIQYPEKPRLVLSQLDKDIIAGMSRIEIMFKHKLKTPSETARICKTSRKKLMDLGLIKEKHCVSAGVTIRNGL